MYKTENAGVQVLPFKRRRAARRAVEIISEDRMPYTGHMRADLVSTTGFKRKLKHGKDALPP